MALIFEWAKPFLSYGSKQSNILFGSITQESLGLPKQSGPSSQIGNIAQMGNTFPNQAISNPKQSHNAPLQLK